MRSLYQNNKELQICTWRVGPEFSLQYNSSEAVIAAGRGAAHLQSQQSE